ncbi:MAG: fenitrothion hydrolase [Solirubrobacteraceae bacterium]
MIVIPFAHGIVGKRDIPIPDYVFGWAAGVVLVLSFVGLAVLWPKPILQPEPARRLCRFPGVLVDIVCGVIGVAIFVAVVYAGFAGVQSAEANLAPTFVYVTFWVGLAFASLLFGNVFGAFNPWRAVARAVAFAARSVSRGSTPEPLRYPAWLGRWPAAVGILCFAWLELVYSSRDDPSTLSILALAYAAVQLVGMSLYGIDTWTDRADAFAVYFGLFGRIAALERRDDGLYVRAPLSALFRLDIVPGTIALLCVMIGSTSFDGFSNGTIWNDVAPDLQKFFVDDLGTTLNTGLELAFTAGLLFMIAFVAAVYRIGVAGMRLYDPDRPALVLARRYVISLVPISLAYVIAHYFSLLAYQGQGMAALISDPLGHGSNLFGTAGAGIDYGVVSASGIWYVQVAALVIGHVAGLMVAHERAVSDYPDTGTAVRSQLWMLGVMVVFTSMGLWILSAAGQA